MEGAQPSCWSIRFPNAVGYSHTLKHSEQPCVPAILSASSHSTCQRVCPGSGSDPEACGQSITGAEGAEWAFKGCLCRACSPGVDYGHIGEAESSRVSRHLPEAACEVETW